jgi:outer membrane protein OmpA-like peptidoglycan-associated protein
VRVLALAILLCAGPAAADVLVDVDEAAPCRAVHAAKRAAGCWRHVRLRGDRIELVTPIVFEHGKGVIRPGSLAVVADLALLLGAHPELVRVEIQGHNGFEESQRSLRLSDARARAVFAALVHAGVDPKRLDYQGYGETMPLVIPRTDEDRRRNTRIEVRVAR